MKFKTIEVGIFRLPGLMIEEDEEHPIREEDLTEMRAWAAEDPKKHGKELIPAKNIWAFKNDKQRNYFIMKWG